MADLDKQNDSLLKMSNENLDKLEEKLSVVYDSLVSINTMVNHSIANLESMQKALLEISNINFTNSSLNISLEGLLKNMDNFVKSAGCAKIELLEISKLYASTYDSISSVPDSSKTQKNVQTEGASDGVDVVDIMNFINGELAGILFGELVKKLLENIPSAGTIGSAVKTGGMSFLLSLLAGLEELIKWISPITDMVSYFAEILWVFIKELPKGKLLLATIAAFITGYYGWRCGEELIDLRKNIEELGEEEGRVTAGTGFMDRQALFQYDKQQSDTSINAVYADYILDWIDRIKYVHDETQKVNESMTQAYVDMFTLLGEGTGMLFTDWQLKQETYQIGTQETNELITESYDVMYEGWREKMNLYQSDTQIANETVSKSFADALTDMGTRISVWWKDEVSTYFAEEKWQFSGISVGLSKSWNTAAEIIRQGVSNLNTWINGNLGNNLTETATGTYVTRIAKPNDLPTYEIGGFPEDGLFMANHGELVGKFTNGKTAVANNEQIVSGIKYGVKEAVTEVLAPYLADIAQNTRETANKDFSTYIGDKEIARASERGRQAMGLQLITEF